MRKTLITIAALFALTGCSPVIENLLPNAQQTERTVTLAPGQLAYRSANPPAGTPNGPKPGTPPVGSPNNPAPTTTTVAP